MNSSRPDRIYGPDDFVNDAQARTYRVLSRLMRGADASKLIRGGGYIEDTAILGTGGTARYYRPGETRSPSNGDGTANYRYGFRFIEADKSWTEQQIKAQGGSDMLTKFKNFRKILDIQLHTMKCGFMENAFWARPDANLMESQSPTDGKGAIYSIPAMVNHSTNTLPVANSTSGSSAFTTIGNIAPTGANANWQNAVGSYSGPNPESPTQGLFAAFDSVTFDIGFEAVPGLSTYKDNVEFSKLAIFTSKKGRTLYQGQIRERKRRFRQPTRATAGGDEIQLPTVFRCRLQ